VDHCNHIWYYLVLFVLPGLAPRSVSFQFECFNLQIENNLLVDHGEIVDKYLALLGWQSKAIKMTVSHLVLAQFSSFDLE
jgi:hypothetical protein